MSLTSEQAAPGRCPAADWQADRRASLIEDYLFIGGDQLSAREAAERLGVSKRTVERYRRELRQAQAVR